MTNSTDTTEVSDDTASSAAALDYVGPFVCLGDLSIAAWESGSKPAWRVPPYFISDHVVAVRVSDLSVWLILAPDPGFPIPDGWEDSDDPDDVVAMLQVVEKFTAVVPPIVQLAKHVDELWSGEKGGDKLSRWDTNLGTKTRPTIVYAGVGPEGQIVSHP